MLKVHLVEESNFEYKMEPFHGKVTQLSKRCYNCGRRGHIACFCSNTISNEKRNAHHVIIEDDFAFGISEEVH